MVRLPLETPRLTLGTFRLPLGILIHLLFVPFWLAGVVMPGFVQAQTPSRADLIEIAREIVAAAPFVALATADENGQPAVRAMDALPPDEDWVVWLATNPASRKVEQLRTKSGVALHYLDSEAAAYVTLVGRARLVDDAAAKAVHWKESWTPFYPDRHESVLLIEVVPERLEVVAAGRGAPGDPETWRAHIVEFPVGNRSRTSKPEQPEE